MTPTERIVALEADVARLQWEVAKLLALCQKLSAPTTQQRSTDETKS